MLEALEALPREWRRTLQMSHVEERSEAEIARRLRKPEPEVKRILDYARQYLRQRLVESGCALRDDAKAAAGR